MTFPQEKQRTGMIMVTIVVKRRTKPCFCSHRSWNKKVNSRTSSTHLTSHCRPPAQKATLSIILSPHTCTPLPSLKCSNTHRIRMSAAGGKANPSQRAARSKGPNRGQAKTKIVVRRLPANLPEHVFMESIKSLVSDASLDRATTWVSGKVSKK